MDQAKKRVTVANMKIEGGHVILHLEMPIKGALIILIAFLVRYVPEFWQAIQIAVSSTPLN